MNNCLQKLYKLIACQGLMLFVLFAFVGGCAIHENSTPEKTLEKFFEGYRQGDKSMVLSTLQEGDTISTEGLGVPQNYRILQKLEFLESSDPAAQPGDVEIRTLRTIKWSDQSAELMAIFQLRKINNEWKIVGYSAYNSSLGSTE